MTSTGLLAASFILGLTHTFEVDHMSAVSAFVATRPRPREAAVFGAQWALGHGAALFIFGSILFLLKIVISPAVANFFERAVGVALLTLGVWTLVCLKERHTHPRKRSGRSAPVWMGALHGMAGTAAFVGQAIVVASTHYSLVILYTVAFSLGVLVSMVVFAGALGVCLKRVGRAVQVMLALITCAVGTFWLLKPL